MSVARFPYVCSLRKKDNSRHVCDGTLVDQIWVLTAAHCVDPALTDSSGLDPVVLCGIRDVHDSSSEPVERFPSLLPLLNAVSKRFNGIKTVLHSDWSGDVFQGYDIAMIQLDKPAQLKTPLVDVLGNLPDIKEQLSTLGWKDDRENKSHSNKLYITTGLNRLHGRTCNALWRRVLPDETVFCADVRKRHRYSSALNPKCQ